MQRNLIKSVFDLFLWLLRLYVHTIQDSFYSRIGPQNHHFVINYLTVLVIPQQLFTSVSVAGGYEPQVRFSEQANTSKYGIGVRPPISRVLLLRSDRREQAET